MKTLKQIIKENIGDLSNKMKILDYHKEELLKQIRVGLEKRLKDIPKMKTAPVSTGNYMSVVKFHDLEDNWTSAYHNYQYIADSIINQLNNSDDPIKELETIIKNKKVSYLDNRNIQQKIKLPPPIIKFLADIIRPY